MDPPNDNRRLINVPCCAAGNDNTSNHEVTIETQQKEGVIFEAKNILLF